jgi:hypothetical protein
MEARASTLYGLVKTRIDFDSIVPTCIVVAREIEQLQGLKGVEKLALLQEVLRLALRDQPISLKEKEDILFVIEKVVPVAVQAAILASKSPIVKHVQEVCMTCCWTKT